MADGCLEQNKQKTGKPQINQPGEQGFRDKNHPQRPGRDNAFVHPEVQIGGNQPKHGAGPGGDSFAQHRKDQKQYQVIQADMQKNPETERKNLFQTFTEAIVWGSHDGQTDEKSGQQERGEKGQISLSVRFCPGIAAVSFVPGTDCPCKHDTEQKKGSNAKKHMIVHNSLRSKSSRSCASSSSVRSLAHKADAKAETFPPHSFRKNRLLWAAR